MTIQEKILLQIYEAKIQQITAYHSGRYGYSDLFKALDEVKAELFQDMNKLTPLGKAMSEGE